MTGRLASAGGKRHRDALHARSYLRVAVFFRVSPEEVRTLFYRYRTQRALGFFATRAASQAAFFMTYGRGSTSMMLLCAILLFPLTLAAYTPCRAPYDTPAAAAFEMPCYDTLHATGALEVRRYPASPPHARTAQVVHVNLTGKITNFTEAVPFGIEFLFCYFQGACSVSHASAYSSRTVPLLVRPPQRGGGDGNWAFDMAMAPSRWPGPVPAGENGIDVVQLDALVAARHCTTRAAPVEIDFAACLAALEADAPALRAAGFAINSTGEWTPTYAYFDFENQTAPPWDIEVWATLSRV